MKSRPLELGGAHDPKKDITLTRGQTNHGFATQVARRKWLPSGQPTGLQQVVAPLTSLRNGKMIPILCSGDPNYSKTRILLTQSCHQVEEIKPLDSVPPQPSRLTGGWDKEFPAGTKAEAYGLCPF